MSHAKSSRIELRTNEDVKKIIEHAAFLTGQTISAYILNHTLSSAKKDIAEMQTVTIPESDKDMFFSLLSNPPAPNDALKNLFK